MRSKEEVLEGDLTIFEVMVAHMPEYLSGESIDWRLRDQAPEMPKLTIGGCLMRQQRLHTVAALLSPQQQERLQTAHARLQHLMMHNVVRFEQKTHQELRARLREWLDCLRAIQWHKGEEQCYYEDKVDTRVVVAAIVAQMQQPPFRLEEDVPAELAALDNNLRQRWQDGPFLWHEVWQEAYPQETYWYLYGRPVLP